MSFRSPSTSDFDTSYSSSDDSVLGTLYMSNKETIVGDFKMNDEAVNIIMRIANTADHNRDFTVQDVDLTEFGVQTLNIDPNLDPKTILNQSQHLASLMTLNSASSSGYSTARSCDSQLSCMTLGSRSDLRQVPWV